MTPEQIEEGNKKIGGFMGYVYYPEVKVPTHFYECELWQLSELETDDAWVLNPKPEFEKYLCVSRYFYEMEDIEQKPYDDWKWGLTYHKSWEDIIEVVEKIESLTSDSGGHWGVHIISNTCTIQDTNWYKKEGFYFCEVTLTTKLESTWSAVVRFIDFYNKLNDR